MWRPNKMDIMPLIPLLLLHYSGYARRGLNTAPAGAASTLHFIQESHEMFCPSLSPEMPRETSERSILFCTEVDGQCRQQKRMRNPCGSLEPPTQPQREKRTASRDRKWMSKKRPMVGGCAVSHGTSANHWPQRSLPRCNWAQGARP